MIDRLDEARTAWREGHEPPDRKLTVGRQLADWLEDRRGKVRASTWISYEGHVRMHLATIAGIGLARLTPADVRRLLRHLEQERLAPRTIAYTLTILRMAIRAAVADGLVARNVASAVLPPRQPRAELHVLSALEVRRLVATTEKDPLGPLWALLVGTGMRLGEGLALRWVDVDLAGATAVVAGSLRPVDRRIRPEGERRLQRVAPKTEASRRTIALPAFVMTALRTIEEARDAKPASSLGLIFTTPRGTPLDPRNVSRAWEDAIAAATLPDIRIHDLRHTAASLMLAQGFTLFDVMRTLGHASIAQTANTYGHLVEGRSREIAGGMDRVVGGLA